jgi:hypothetical protein
MFDPSTGPAPPLLRGWGGGRFSFPVLVHRLTKCCPCPCAPNIWFQTLQSLLVELRNLNFSAANATAAGSPLRATAAALVNMTGRFAEEVRLSLLCLHASPYPSTSQSGQSRLACCKCRVSLRADVAAFCAGREQVPSAAPLAGTIGTVLAVLQDAAPDFAGLVRSLERLASVASAFAPGAPVGTAVRGPLSQAAELEQVCVHL